jgi:hypothetical protein
MARLNFDKTYPDSFQYEKALKMCQIEGKYVMIDDQGKVFAAGPLRRAYEHIKGFGGGIDHLNPKEREKRLIDFLDYGKSRNWLDSREARKIETAFTAQIGLSPWERIHRFEDTFLSSADAGADFSDMQIEEGGGDLFPPGEGKS